MKRYITPLILTLFFILASLSASAQTKGEPPQPGPETTNAPPSPVAPKTPSGQDIIGAGVNPNSYVLGPEDVISIRTWREPDFTFAMAVRPDGKITLPLVGDVQAGGLTPMQLTKSVKEKIGKYLNNPDVTVFVVEVRSKKYYIDGEVNKPGPYPLVVPTTVLEALSNAAGFKEFANEKNIKILRGSKNFRFNYKEVTSGKHMEQNIYLENGDHIIVH